MSTSLKAEIIQIKFEGIDFWERPIYKQIDSNNRFGSIDKLCNTIEEIKAITESDLVFFGTSFDCEPWGDPPGNIKIIHGELT